MFVQKRMVSIQGDIVQQILDLQYIHPGKIIWIIGGATLIEATHFQVIDEFVLSRIPEPTVVIVFTLKEI